MKQPESDFPLSQQLFTVYAEFYRPNIATANRILTPYRLHSAQRTVLKRLRHIEPHKETKKPS